MYIKKREVRGHCIGGAIKTDSKDRRKFNMRRALTLALAGVMAVSLVGCGGSGTSTDNKSGDDTKKSVKLNVTTTYAGETQMHRTTKTL